MQLIPAIDLRGGRCVRLYQGDFDAETAYPVHPQILASRYRDWGADWLHVVDLDGARDGARLNRLPICEIAALDGLRVQSGGGVRDERTVQELLGAGIERVVIGSAAVSHSGEVESWLARFGAERIVLAFDVRLDRDAHPRLATHGWRDTSQWSLWDAVERFAPFGLRHVLCTDIGRDGALNGPNTELYELAVRRYPAIAWQASGGIRSSADLRALSSVGVASAISGKALLERHFTHEELRPYLPNASSPA